MDLFEELLQLTSRLDEEQVEYALCGGLAMAVHAFPRATLDIDILIEPETLERAKTVAKGIGFSFDAGLMKFQKDAVQIYRLTKPFAAPDDALVLDMLLVTPEMANVWKTRQRLAWDKGTIPVVSPEGLIQMKLLRQSGQDQDDIQSLRGMIHED